ncbi:MAG: hypothetical protein GTO08_05685, partial [Deltaproteobacteria bacterium]|nr:hypothetical protein [Deltaproteobacteria bacterium]
EDRIFVSHTGVHRVSAFEKNGRFLFSLNDKGKLAGDDQSKGFGRVAGVRLNPQKDTLYVMDGQAMKVFVYTLDGKLVKSISPQLPKPPEKELVFYSLEVDGDGNIWIPDARNNKVRIFNPQGKEIRTFGKEGELFAPGFSTIDGKNDRFYVVNTRKDKVGISVFALDGKFIRFFGEKGVGPGKFWAPGGIDVMEDGSIVEADAINSYINVFDPETGRLKYHFLAEDGKDIVQIASARGIRVTGDRLYVCSSIINEVDVLEMFGDIFEVK